MYQDLTVSYRSSLHSRTNTDREQEIHFDESCGLSVTAGSMEALAKVVDRNFDELIEHGISRTDPDVIADMLRKAGKDKDVLAALSGRSAA
ncbi:hypothetical protein ACISK3_05160 [Morganella morganii]|nr:hypothetical protein [Morganella morganii]